MESKEKKKKKKKKKKGKEFLNGITILIKIFGKDKEKTDYANELLNQKEINLYGGVKKLK